MTEVIEVKVTQPSNRVVHHTPDAYLTDGFLQLTIEKVINIEYRYDKLIVQLAISKAVSDQLLAISQAVNMNDPDIPVDLKCEDEEA